MGDGHKNGGSAGGNGSGNGAGSGPGSGPGNGHGRDLSDLQSLILAPSARLSEQAPERVRDLAEGCVRFVQRALGVALDYEPETLSLLDHWVAEARGKTGERPEAAALVAHAAGAYFGEVVRRRYPAWWRAEGDDPSAWRVELEPVYLSFSPVQLMVDAIHRPEGAEIEAAERLELTEEDREAVAARLAELPPVSEDEFYAPSTRLEVIDIAVDAIRARRMGEGDPADQRLGPGDYEA